MKHLLLSLTFILTTSVMAQAADTSPQKWVTHYSTETEVNGLPVRATLDVAQMDGKTPIAIMEDSVPAKPSEFRLNLLVSEYPRVQLSFKLQPRTVSINGTPQVAYVSDLSQDQNLHFLITNEANGALHVNYSQAGENGQLLTGEFSLAPVLHIL